jgi:hypothetical protein
MNVRKLINERFRRRANGVDVQGDVNAVVAANVNERGGSTSVSSKQVSRRQVERQDGEELPEREAMSLVNANLAAPLNAAAALNVLSDDSTAVANAEQTEDIDQSN